MTAVVPLLCLLAGWSARLESPRWRDRERATAALPRAVALLLTSSPRAEVAWRAREAMARQGRLAEAAAKAADDALLRRLRPRGWDRLPWIDSARDLPSAAQVDWDPWIDQGYAAGGKSSWPDYSAWRIATLRWMRHRLSRGESEAVLRRDLELMATWEYDWCDRTQGRYPLPVRIEDSPPGR